MNWKPTIEDNINRRIIDFALDFKLAQAKFTKLDYTDKGLILRNLDIEIALEYGLIYEHIIKSGLESKFIHSVKHLFNKRREQGCFIETISSHT